MLKRVILFITLLACTLPSAAQSDTLSLSAKLRRARNLARWHIPPGNYSGITPLGNNTYAVVTDKPKQNGFYIFSIKLKDNGKIASVTNEGFRTDGAPGTLRDSEGIAFHPSTNTLFIAAENDQQVIEYDINGNTTGRHLHIPEQVCTYSTYSNYGFESLTHSSVTHTFWTISENTLRRDGQPSGNRNTTPALLRLLAFSDSTLQYSAQYAYKTDKPHSHNTKARGYCFGVPEILAMPDGSLLILERELVVHKRLIGSYVRNKIYQVRPSQTEPIHFSNNLFSLPDSTFIRKTLITQFTTHNTHISNYEAMCLGPILPDGSQSILLLCDSQDNYGKTFFHLRDRIKVILLK